MTIKTPILLLSLMLLTACADLTLNSPIAGPAPIKNDKSSGVDSAGAKPGAGAACCETSAATGDDGSAGIVATGVTWTTGGAVLRGVT